MQRAIGIARSRPRSSIMTQYLPCDAHQVLERFRFREETTGKIFSGVGEDLKVQDLSVDAKFNYERELQAFFDKKKVERTNSCIMA